MNDLTLFVKTIEPRLGILNAAWKLRYAVESPHNKLGRFAWKWKACTSESTVDGMHSF